MMNKKQFGAIVFGLLILPLIGLFLDSWEVASSASSSSASSSSSGSSSSSASSSFSLLAETTEGGYVSSSFFSSASSASSSFSLSPSSSPSSSFSPFPSSSASPSSSSSSSSFKPPQRDESSFWSPSVRSTFQFKHVSSPSPVSPTSSTSSSSSSSSSSALPSREDIFVLLWDNPGSLSWSGIGSGDILETPNYVGHWVNKTRRMGGKTCPIRCTFAGSRTFIDSVDVVVFDQSAHWEDWEREGIELPLKRPQQFWLEFGFETSLYFPLQATKTFSRQIDLRQGFSQHSDIPITFICSWGGGTIDEYLKPPLLPKKSDKIAAYFASNCDVGGADLRTEYVRELMQYIPVDSYGGCLHNKEMPEEHRQPEDHGTMMKWKIEILKEYKFTLAFENSNVTDYVSEKLPSALLAGSVPVYMGAPNIEEYLPGEHSIIRTDQFKGPKELAEHLLWLIDHPVAYRSYFEWKKKGLSQKFRQKYSQCVFYSGECRLCMKVAEKMTLPKKPIDVNLSWTAEFDGQGSKVVIVPPKHKLVLESLIRGERKEEKRNWKQKRKQKDGEKTEKEEKKEDEEDRKKLKKENRKEDMIDRKNQREKRSEDEVENQQVTAEEAQALQFEEELFQFQDQFSIVAWIHPKRLENDRIVDKNHAGDITGFLFDLMPVGQRTFLRVCAALECYVGKKPISKDTWYHVAVTFDLNEKKQVNEERTEWKGEAERRQVSFYVDGELDCKLPIRPLTRMNLNDLPLTIGAPAFGEGNHWMGYIDEVSIWSVALPLEAIRLLQFHKLLGDEEGLEGYWTFDGEDIRSSTVIDSSRHGRYGEFINPLRVFSEEKPLHFIPCF